MYYRVILWIMALTVFTVGGRAAADETLTFKFQEDVDHGQGVYKDCNDVTINKPGTVPIAELSPYIYINTDYATSREWYNTLIRFDHLANYLPEQGLSLEVVEAYLTLTFYNDGSYQPAVEAEVEIKPETVNLASRGKWIRCYIRLGEGYDVGEIEAESVLLEYEVQAESVRIDEQRQVAVARFRRPEVRGFLEAGENEVTISGELTDGTIFEGADIIRVIDRRDKKKADLDVVMLRRRG